MAEHSADGLRRLIGQLRVPSGRKVDLAKDYDPRFKAGWLGKEQGEAELRSSIELLAGYQAKLAAQNTFGLLVVLQALDAAGKDGTIRHVMSGVNPQGVTVHSFKVPSDEELAHDFLWRYVQRLPARGQTGIFNRSHYEEVLVVRVHPELLTRQRLPITDGIWKRRYREINEWERYLVDNGIRIVKLLLNVSREEQCRRFLERIENPDKNWKFSPHDVQERRHWGSYQQAFSDMLTHTSTEWAPWYVIPADHKWFAHLAVGAVLTHALMEIDPHYPTVDAEMKKALEEARVELGAQADTSSAHRAAS